MFLIPAQFLIVLLYLCNGITSMYFTHKKDNFHVLNESKNFTVYTKEDFNFQCRTEVPTVLLEHDRNYKVLNELVKEYYSAIMVCCPGYKRDKFDRKKCVPDCDDKCDNGYCVEPGRCQCFDGYIMNPNSGECIQTCPVSCANGRCKKDNTCHCKTGYRLDYTGKLCEPICEESCGNHQVCSAPNECACDKGYKLSRHGCVPKCVPDCGFGICTHPNRCSCLNGYHLKDGICQASCYHACGNGFCKGVNHCICNDGFVFDERAKTCIPDQSWIKDFRIEP